MRHVIVERYLRGRGRKHSSFFRISSSFASFRSRLGKLADSWIPIDDKLTCPDDRGFKIIRSRWQNLPACGVLPQDCNRTHRWKYFSKTLVVFDGCRNPNAVISWKCFILPQHKNNLLFNVDGITAKHGFNDRLSWVKVIENKFERNALLR